MRYRAESREQRAESREQRADRREQRAESREQRAESREQRAESREQRAVPALANSNRTSSAFLSEIKGPSSALRSERSLISASISLRLSFLTYGVQWDVLCCFQPTCILGLLRFSPANLAKSGKLWEHSTQCYKQRREIRDQRAENRGQRAESREQRTEKREQQRASREVIEVVCYAI
jgi:hypothetical protein